MKIAELFENNEFENSNDKITLDYLYRVQASRCHHLSVLLQHLCKSYPDEMGWIDTLIYNFFPNASIRDVRAWSLEKVATNGATHHAVALWSDKEQQQYDQKYNRMVKAKRAYEQAGGNYK